MEQNLAARRRRQRNRKQKNIDENVLNTLMPDLSNPVSYLYLAAALFKALLPTGAFVKNSIRLVKRCTKPNRQEFRQAALATAVGFLIMGFIGFFVKLLHIPVTNIIIG
ncbi:protein transport protein Sec61 subunit gamma [Scaptodrosophila lebanonensis]|uniref:Protein transport protein Sec61 subunit gamma n=1 Tax=Drosophila lebanonensis TaxID=7225 RepID=A0A6J2UF99_DROLE|nr:protein transport protein Sec61 subunit gamma [Scaptodrosophila lebanonensis]